MTEETEIALLGAEIKYVKETVDRIEAQTKKTNGSVADLYAKYNKLSNWRSYITGGLAVAAFALSIAMWFFTSILPNLIKSNVVKGIKTSSVSITE